MSDSKSWIPESEKTLIDSPFMQIVEQNCVASEDGRKHKFMLFRSRDWANIIPVTEDGKVVMVRQYRVGIAQSTIEIPGGVVDPSDAHVQEAAIREMIEETGYVPCEGAICEALGSTYPNPAILNNRSHFFVIGPVKKDREQKLDSGEMIDVIEVPIKDIPAMIARGDINHAVILNAFLLLALKINGGSGGAESLIHKLETFSGIQRPLEN